METFTRKCHLQCDRHRLLHKELKCISSTYTCIAYLYAVFRRNIFPCVKQMKD